GKSSCPVVPVTLALVRDGAPIGKSIRRRTQLEIGSIQRQRSAKSPMRECVASACEPKKLFPSQLETRNQELGTAPSGSAARQTLRSNATSRSKARFCNT